jgi:hypothetical protein
MYVGLLQFVQRRAPDTIDDGSPAGRGGVSAGFSNPGLIRK